MNLDNDQILATFERYKENFVALGLHVYSYSASEDLLLLRWYFYLCESGDVEKIVVPENRRLSSFLSIFQSPTVTFYGLSAQNEVDFIAWFKEPSGSAIFAGIWTSPTLRGSRRLIYIIQNVYSLIFEFYSSILGLTWQPELLQLHTKIGYAITGNFTDFMGQSQVWLTQLTKQSFMQSRIMQIGRK